MSDGAGLEFASPREAGFSPELPARLTRLIGRRIGTAPKSLAPSAVALVARDGRVVYEAAFGAARSGTIFDLASVTKAAATAVGLMLLVEGSGLDLDGRLSDWLPGWRGEAKEGATLRQLLAHRAGLWEWRPVYLHATDPAGGIDFVTRCELRYPPDSGRHYSDLGLMLAARILERASGLGLGSFLERQVYSPLGLTTMTFRPPVSWRERIAPSAQGDWIEQRMIATGMPHAVPERGAHFAGWRRHLLWGEVADCNAHHALAAEAGHAGLFGAAADLARLGAALTSGELVSAATLAEFGRDQFDPGQGLVFRTPLLAGVRCLWHPGFTGTDWLFCPELRLVVVLLTNRLNCEGEPKMIEPLWEALLELIAVSLVR